MNHLWNEIRRKPLLWLLIVVPLVFVVEHSRPQSHTLIFVLSVLAIVPLAALLMVYATFAMTLYLLPPGTR